MRRFCSSRTIVSQTLVELPSQQVHRTFIVSQTQVSKYRLTNESATRIASSHSNSNFFVSQYTNESATRTSSSHNLKCSNFIVSQTQVHLELRRLTNESVSSSHKRKCFNFIVSETKVQLQLHRLTNIVTQSNVELHFHVAFSCRAGRGRTRRWPSDGRSDVARLSQKVLHGQGTMLWPQC